MESFLLYAKTSCAPLRGGCKTFRVPYTGVQRSETATVTLLVQPLGNCSLLYISFDQKKTAEISAGCDRVKALQISCEYRQRKSPVTR